MERFFQVHHSVPRNERNVSWAALTVAKELYSLWQIGGARIPLLRLQTIKVKIVGMHEDLLFINRKSKAGQPTYVAKVGVLNDQMSFR